MATITVTVTGTTVMVGDGDTVIIDIPGGGEVTIIADPNDNVDKVKIEFVNDSEADTVIIDLSTFSEDDLHIDIHDYDPTDSIHILGAFNRYVDPSDVDEYTFEYVGADGETYTGFVHAKDKGEKDFTAADPPIIICFGKGTLIETGIGGCVPVEDLRIGDLVATADGDPASIRWIGQTTLDTLALTRAPHLRPVLVRPDALGVGCPTQDLVLSPNHRVLVSDWRAQIFYGEDEVLVPIKSLINGKSILVDHFVTSVTYYHLLLDSHQIVKSNGVFSESLFLGGQSLDAISDASHQELRATIPEDQLGFMKKSRTVKPVLRFKEAVCLAA